MSYSIKNWSEEDRPREKFISSGKAILSNAELIAIIIRTGSQEKSAVELARDILQVVDNDLQRLSQLTVGDLTKIKGVGKVKAVTILAALELGTRKGATVISRKTSIQSSQDAYDVMKSSLSELKNEEFWVVFLNQAHKVIGRKKISEGGITGTVVDPRVLFKQALDFGATSIIVYHNHPSGNIIPSAADKSLTKKLFEGGKVMDIKLIDHIIIGGNNYFSFKDEGLL